MLSKKDRAKLIDALNTALALNVPDKEAQKNIAIVVGQGLDVPFLDHFVEACIKSW